MTAKTLRAAVATIVLCAIFIWAGAARAERQKITVGKHREMTAILIAPDGPGPFPAVLVLHTSDGLGDADLAFAERLSKQGYVCLVPEFLDAYGITARSRADTFTTFATDIYDDFSAAVATLQHYPKVAGSKVGAVGFSNGGYFAMWLAATGKVVVVLYDWVSRSKVPIGDDLRQRIERRAASGA